ncbi:hypothetical protein Scep_007251 [Stephania cephalantha]|uniref:Uncharacterized protein n=1 Tax=Stephania cephalantha TaxID=152367 RepID=A0AAP0PN19_9MAGN
MAQLSNLSSQMMKLQIGQSSPQGQAIEQHVNHLAMVVNPLDMQQGMKFDDVNLMKNLNYGNNFMLRGMTPQRYYQGYNNPNISYGNPDNALKLPPGFDQQVQGKLGQSEEMTSLKSIERFLQAIDINNIECHKRNEK